MPRIGRDSLLTLEAYAKARPQMRSKAIAHKRARSVHLGEHVTLLFEDETTIRYQVQEMLRIEKMFEEAGIQDELDVYNPLIPDGSNLKATMLIEYEDENVRRQALSRLKGIEDDVWVEVGDEARVTSIADEDLDRETQDKTSSVHFLRFEFTPSMITAWKLGAKVTMGVDHPEYRVETTLTPEQHSALAADFT